MDERTLTPDDTILNIYKSFTFTTPDPPEAVLKYYREQLTNDGWQVADFQPDPHALLLQYTTFDRPPTTYYCDISTKQTPTNTTVQIDLRDATSN
jgi:predicted RNA-binding protein associated with RNAse of E/G family